MPIKEESFRIGCGRYLQKPNLLEVCGSEIARYGKNAFVVGDDTSLSLALDTIKESAKKAQIKCKSYTHNGSCNEDAAKELAIVAGVLKCDVIVGVGGGVIMDFAKLIGFHAGAPVINIPTSSATCACYTPLSVCYTKEGHTVGTKHFEYEVDSVLVDTALIARQPARLLLAGVFDALAKYIEIKQRYNDSDYPLGLDWAHVLSQRSFSELVKKTEPALADMQKGEVTDAIEQVVFASLAATGVISGIARGSNQCALAHKFYETTRTLFFENSRPYLHGEIVGIGLLMQNFFNGEEKENEFLLSVMKKYNMPHSVYDIGIPADAAELYYEKLIKTSAIDETNQNELENLKKSLEYLWGIK